MATDEDREFIILRPEGLSSIEFKRRSFDKIKGWTRDHGGVVAGAFENEPENMNAMLEQFPGALHVFVSGAFLKNIPLNQ